MEVPIIITREAFKGANFWVSLQTYRTGISEVGPKPKIIFKTSSGDCNGHHWVRCSIDKELSVGFIAVLKLGGGQEKKTRGSREENKKTGRNSGQRAVM